MDSFVHTCIPNQTIRVAKLFLVPKMFIVKNLKLKKHLAHFTKI